MFQTTNQIIAIEPFQTRHPLRQRSRLSARGHHHETSRDEEEMKSR